MIVMVRGAGRLVHVLALVSGLAAETGSPVSVRMLCAAAVLRLPVSGATLTTDAASGWSETRHCTDALGEQLAELQVTVGEGPAVDARRAGGPVLVAELDTASSQRRWPLFAPLAVEAGAGALFALPLCVGAIRVGILALHRGEAGPLDQPALVDALAFAELALRLLLAEQAGVLAGGGPDLDVPLHEPLHEPLHVPLHDPRVHQATGVVAAQLGVGVPEAFARLRARAFADGRPLAELAADVVAHRARFDRTGERPVPRPPVP